MAAPAWPSTLPQNLRMEGFGETWPAVAIRTKMDAGPAKSRRRLTNNVMGWKGVLYVTDAQYQTLFAFYLSDCAGGALAFTWIFTDFDLCANFPALVVDITLGTVQMWLRWVAPPTRKVIVPGATVGTALFEVTLDLEVMP